MTDLEKAVAELTAKQARVTWLHDYYRGAHPLVYTSERLREIFRPLDARFTSNWCSVVIDACADRITLEQLTVQDDEAAQSAMDELWRTLTLAIEADDTHDTALWAGESFLVIWPDPETDEIQACYNDPRLCHVEYDAASPKRKKWAAKWWEDESAGYCYLTLYYPDRIEYYEASRKHGEHGEAGVDYPAPQDRSPYGSFGYAGQQYGYQPSTQKAPIDAKRFQPREDLPEAPNPYGVIPVFHFQNKGRQSDLLDAIPLQNGINKLMVDLMVGAEFGAFPQKWAITQIELGTSTDASGNPTGSVLKLKNAPNEVWNLPASDGQGQATSVGQFSPTDLGNFLLSINQLVSHIGAITRTPRHYFFQQGGDPSGESLIVMEAPLNKKAQDRIDRFSPTWSEAGAFLLQLRGMTVSVSAVTPIFARPQTIQPLTEAQIRKANVETGIPLAIQLQDEGWSEADIAELETKKEEAAQQALERAQAMAKMQPQQPPGKPPGKPFERAKT